MVSTLVSIYVSALANGVYRNVSELRRHVSAVSLIATQQLHAPRISGASDIA